MEKLISNVDGAAAEVHETPEETDPATFHRVLEKYHDAVWKIAGLIVALETDKKISVPRRLWFTMAFAPVKVFRWVPGSRLLTWLYGT